MRDSRYFHVEEDAKLQILVINCDCLLPAWHSHLQLYLFGVRMDNWVVQDHSSLKCLQPQLLVENCSHWSPKKTLVFSYLAVYLKRWTFPKATKKGQIKNQKKTSEFVYWRRKMQHFGNPMITCSTKNIRENGRNCESAGGWGANEP